LPPKSDDTAAKRSETTLTKVWKRDIPSHFLKLRYQKRKAQYARSRSHG